MSYSLYALFLCKKICWNKQFVFCLPQHLL
jgi:hypothetical protein